jgi:hypothetical protein
MSYFVSLLKEAVRLKVHESMLQQRFDLQARLQDTREARQTALQVAREAQRNPPMDVYEITYHGSIVGAVCAARNGRDTDLWRAIELILPAGERIISGAVSDGFYFLKCTSGVVCKARLK